MSTTSTDNNAPESAAPLPESPKPKRLRKISRAMLIILLLGILTPVGITLGFGVSALVTYNVLRNQAHDAVQHLLNVKTIFTGVKTHPTGFLDSTKLHNTQKELAAARTDFQQMQNILEHNATISAITTFLPQYRTQITSARAASQVGLDTTDIGQELVSTALILAPTFRSPLLTDPDAHTPLVTQSMLNLITTTVNNILPRLSDISTQTHSMSINALPISAQQRSQLVQLLSLLPTVQTDVTQVQNLLGVASWVLGVDGPRTFLVQTMDRAELRPTGGFTGQYGELHIDGGRVVPFTLRDISLIEYADNSPTYGQLPPAQYQSWWPFANWGLRDSNLSADFPTSAKLAISLYQYEVGHKVDGVISFTPILIEQILQIIGPIHISGYNETITPQNLEQRLHYYQLDNAGILKQAVVQPGASPTSQRKLFTSDLASALIDRVRHAPPDKILAIASQMLNDLKTRELQVYFANPQVEALLMQYGDAGQMDRSTTHDGLYVVQANLSASKASQYVQTIMHDTVTLNAAGGATHVLQLRLVYNELGPVYGYDTYRDYVRIYVPPTSKFLSGDGFDTGQPLCGGPYAPCPQQNVYPNGELICPTGTYQAGAAAPSPIDPDGAELLPLDELGPPTERVSDEPGRAMFGGWIIVPKNCTATVTLSWYVPPMGSSPYSLLVQRQAGTFPEMNLTILPTSADCPALKTSGLHFDGTLTQDATFSLKGNAPAANCSLQPNTLGSHSRN